MKTNYVKILTLTALVSVASVATAQKLQLKEVEIPTSKAVKKKGMYVNTTLTKEGDIRSYVAYDQKNGDLGFDVLTVSASGKVKETANEIASKASQVKYGIEIPEPNTVINPGKGVEVVRLVGSSGMLGKLKIEDGHFEPKYATSIEYGEYVTTRTSILRGYKFKDDNKTESDMRLNIYAAHCEPGADLERNYSILEGVVSFTVGYFDRNAIIAFVGTDARNNKKDSPNSSQNVIISGQFNGKTKSFSNIKEHVMEYNQNAVANGYDGKGNRTILVAALNAPSSVAAHKKWQAKGIQYMSFLSFDTESNLIDKVTFESKSIRGNFAVYGHKNANYVLGSVNGSHTGYYRFDVGSPSDFQIVKIVGSEVVQQKTFSMDQLAEKLITPGGKKGKLKYKDIKFKGFEEAPNGDLLAYAQSAKEYIIYQFDTDANMKVVYIIPAYGAGYAIQTMQSNGDLYVMFREQSGEISQGIKKKISRGAGYMKNTNFSRVDEVMTYGRIVKINAANQSCTEYVDIIGDVILGENSMFKGADGELMLPTRDSKKNYKVAIIK